MKPSYLVKCGYQSQTRKMKNVPPELFILLITAATWCPMANCEINVRRHFVRERNITCSSTQDVRAVSKVACSASCSKLDAPCLGFGYMQLSMVCTLCFACPQSPQVKMFASDDLVYSTMAADFEKEQEKGMIKNSMQTCNSDKFYFNEKTNFN